MPGVFAPGYEHLGDVNIEELLARQQEAFAQSERDADEEAQNPFGRHRWVKLQNLQTANLNGQYAEIIVPANENDRFGVQVHGEKAKKLIRRSNLQPIPDADTVRVCRIAAKGEENFVGGYIQDTRWPVTILDAVPYEISAVSSCLGFPVRISRVHARSNLGERAQWDNQWATYMMIDPKSGFAPLKWQSHVGPVVVWRPDGDVSSDDMCMLNDFLSDLLNGGCSEGTLVPERDLAPQAWARAKTRILENQQLNPHMQQYKDLNI